jgi:hypothetical protein
MDLVAAEYDRRITVVVLTGQEVLATMEALEDAAGTGPFSSDLRLLPDHRTKEVEPDRTYRVAVKGWTYHWTSKYIKLPDFRTTEHTVRDAVARFWPVVER